MNSKVGPKIVKYAKKKKPKPIGWMQGLNGQITPEFVNHHDQFTKLNNIQSKIEEISSLHLKLITDFQIKKLFLDYHNKILLTKY